MDASMKTGTLTRPTGIAITAWLWIAIGALMVFGGIMGGFAYSMMREVDQSVVQGGAVPEPVVMSLLFRNFGVVLVLQCALGALAIWAGIDLLRLKAWARVAIEVLCWLGLLWTVGFGLYWVYMWVSMSGEGSGSFQVMGVVIGAVTTLVFAVPLGLMLRYLRTNEVRQVISRSTGT